MPTTPVTPYVPQYITVHLGAPSAAAECISVGDLHWQIELGL